MASYDIFGKELSIAKKCEREGKRGDIIFSQSAKEFLDEIQENNQGIEKFIYEKFPRWENEDSIYLLKDRPVAII